MHKDEKSQIKGQLFQKAEIAIFSAAGAGAVLDKFKELAQIVALSHDHGIEFHPNAGGRAAAGNDSTESEALYPDFVVGEPESDFHFGSGLDVRGGFDQTSAHAGIGKIAPDGSGVVVDAEFDGDEAFDTGMAPAIAAPVVGGK